MGLHRIFSKPVYAITRQIVGNPATLRVANAAYNLAPEWVKIKTYKLAKAFRDVEGRSRSSVWHVKLGGGRTIQIPLRAGSMWLDWDQAVAVVGHDTEVKDFYSGAIKKSEFQTFVDIGANYGIHSMLFLSAGVRTITFEPNPNCHELFREMCRLNAVAGNLQPFALSDRPGHAALSFPEHDTWFGSLASPEREGLDSVAVEVKTLDSYTDEVSGAVLVKIDVEGFELNVLRGSEHFIAAHRPVMIFESNDGDASRPDIFKFFEDHHYRVSDLVGTKQLTSSEFVSSVQTNFLAKPLLA